MLTIFEILRETRAILTDDHFVYNSGKHASIYVLKDRIYPHTQKSSEVGLLIANRIQAFPTEVVVGPAQGGIVLTQWTADHLSRIKGREILAVYTNKDSSGVQRLSRGYDDFVQGKNVLVVEDITSTGKTVKEVMEAVTNASGLVIAVCAMINHDSEKINTESLGVFYSSLGEFKTQMFDPESCPMCKENVPINASVGHGRDFLSKTG